jgi:hypothetical protein
VSAYSCVCVLILLLYMCPHTTAIYVSSYCYVSSYSYTCVLMIYVSSCSWGVYDTCVWYMCPHTPETPTDAATRFLASSYICVLFLLYMCPHTAMCPHTRTHVSDICVLILLRLQRMLLLASSLIWYMCPHAPEVYMTHVSDICVLILLYSNWCSYSLPRWYDIVVSGRIDREDTCVLCPHTTTYVYCVLLILLHMCTVSSYYYICDT